MRILERIKNFRGIKIQLLTIRTNRFDGYGLSIFELQWSWKGKVCLISNSKTFFHFNFSTDYSKRCRELRLFVGIFFMTKKMWSKIIIPKKDNCDCCGDYCDTKEYYKNKVPYCSEECAE